MALKKFCAKAVSLSKLKDAIKVVGNLLVIAYDVFEVMGKPERIDIWYDNDDKSVVLTHSENGGLKVRNKIGGDKRGKNYMVVSIGLLQREVEWLKTKQVLPFRGIAKIDGKNGYLFRSEK